MSENTIVLATTNKGKIAELSSLLSPFGQKVLGLNGFADLPPVEETGVTFEENALLKASTISALTGILAIADDSGLEVDCLGKAPGVYSARYSAEPGREATDESNIQKLLREMQGVPEGSRTARFRCAMAACSPEGKYITAEGAWEGVIAEEPSGNNGFGYDPVFFDPELGCTAANLTREEKNSRSHRARAAAALLALWPDFIRTCSR